MSTAKKTVSKKALDKTRKLVKQSSAAMKEEAKAVASSHEAKEVLKSMIMPGVMNDVRFTSSYTNGPTSLAQVKTPLGITFPIPSYTYGLATRTSSAGFVFRDPVRNAVVLDGNPTAKVATYLLYWQLVTGSIDSPETTSPSYYGNAGPMRMAYALSNTDYQPHGPMLGVGLANGKTYVWSQKNYTWSIADDAVTTKRLLVYKWTPRGEVFVGQFNTTGGTPLATLALTGYIRFEIYKYNGVDIVLTPLESADTVSLSFTVSGPIFCHISLPDYKSKVQSGVEKVRILSQGFLFTNTTPAIGRGGKIAQNNSPATSLGMNMHFLATMPLPNSLTQISVTPQMVCIVF